MNPPRTDLRTLPSHLHSLDALRGLAALTVVFYHWQHFSSFYPEFDREKQPLFRYLGILYTEGWRAVDLFFCLSGFIFFWLYAEKISRRETSLREFAILRFSRLYPLHFATLLFVAAGQQFMLRRHGGYFVYAENDLFHFGLQAVFASAWGFERGYSFNGPIWSVSVEILLYALFFLTSSLNFRRAWHLVLLTLTGYLMIRCGNLGIGKGMLSFFTGGLAFHIFASLWRRNLSRSTLRCLAAIAIALWIASPLLSHSDAVYHFYKVHVWSDRWNVNGHDAAGAFLLSLRAGYFHELLLFPMTIVTLAFWETRRGSFTRRFAFLGQISYSSYLLHFPLQMVFAATVLAFSIPNTFYYSPFALVLFFSLLIPLSLLSFHFLERPCQSLLRERFLYRASETRSRALGR